MLLQDGKTIMETGMVFCTQNPMANRLSFFPMKNYRRWIII